MAFNENSRVKIPALLHLMKMGYTYIPLREHIRREDTNIFESIFLESLRKINPSAQLAACTYRQVAIPRKEWSKRKLGMALLACPHAIAMGVSGILRGYLGTLAQPQHKVLVYLAVYRMPCKRRKGKPQGICHEGNGRIRPQL